MLHKALRLTVALGLASGLLAGADFTIVTDPPWPVYPRPAIEINTFWTTTFSTTGGYAPYGPWVVSTPPPDGMTFDPVTGILSGRPTTVGNYKWGLGKTCCGGNGSSGVLYDIKVVGPLTLVTTVVPPAYAGEAYSFQFTASGGLPPYTFGMPPLRVPTGMTFNSATGLLSGIGSGNQDYDFTVTVSDLELRTVTKSYTLTVSGRPQLAFNSKQVKFDTSASGSKQSQTVGIASSSGSSLPVTITPDTPKPAWINVTPTTAKTPVEVKIEVDPFNLKAGSYTTNLTVTDTSGQAPPVPIQVDVDVLSKPPALEVTPANLNLTAPSGATVPVAAYLVVRNGGTGPLAVSAAVGGKTPWLGVAPDNVTAPAGEYAAFTVTANPTQVDKGGSSGVLHLTSAGGNADVPVSFVKEDSGPRMEISFQGLQFNGNPGQAATAPQQIQIRNSGSGSFNWSASLIKDTGNFLVTPTSGTATADAPSTITIQARPTNLTTGIHYSLLRISGVQAAQSPQDVMLVLDIEPTSTPIPELSPEGVILLLPPTPSAIAAQDVTVWNSTATSVNFLAAANADGDPAWLSVTPATGKVSSDAPATVTVKASNAGLQAGVYTGTVTVGFSGTVMRTIPVTLIVAAGVPAPRTARALFVSASAATTRLVLTPAGPASHFPATAGWPVSLSAIVLNQAGNPVIDANVSATFSTGDGTIPLRLADPATGLYTATWVPARTSAVTVGLRAAQAGLPVVSAQISGTVDGNPNVPVIAQNGVLNNLNGVLGAAVAPGTVAAIYGSGLSSQTVTEAPVPLPATLGGTTVLVGGIAAPLYYVTPGQIAVQIPTELDGISPQSVTVMRDDAVSVPVRLNLAPASPGVAASADGRALAQHLDYSLITSAAPAHPGEWITLYLVGMGATDGTVASGQRAPSTTLLHARIQPKVTIDDAAAEVYFAGLTPDGIGLYQINCRVPVGARSGDLTAVVTQNDVPANSVILPVAQ